MDFQTLLNWLWVTVAAALVFFMQAGFAMVESGMTRSKNSINVAVKNLTDLGVSLLVFWLFGFALMFGTSRSGLIGTTLFAPDFSASASTLSAGTLAVFFLFQAMFCSTSATIVSGAVAERMRYSGYIVSTFFLSAVIYPVFGHWAWGGLGGELISGGAGWLSSIGFVDFAGSTVVHSVGGYVALACLIVLGPRSGRYSADGKATKIPGSNIPLSVAGVIVLWFGWIGFNGGSTLAMTGAVPSIILHTCLSAAAGLVAALFLGWAITGLPDVDYVMNGALAGLVAITAGCHAVSSLDSIVIGAVAGVVMLAATKLLEALRIDDAVGAIPVHLAAGIWGTLAVGIFGDPAALGTTPAFGSQLLVQLIGVAACALWAFPLSLASLWAFNLFFKLRVTPAEEHIGLNAAEHGAVTELAGLFSVMEEQSRTGDLSLRAPVEPFTEAGQIAALYNRVLSGLELNTIAKDEYREIFSNVSDGLFLIDPAFRICPNYSAATEKIFLSRNLEGRDVKALFGRMLAPDKSRRFDEFIGLMFDPSHHERSISAMNPLQATHFKVSAGYDRYESRLLDFSFYRIWDRSKTKIVHVMAVARDNTRLSLLAKEVRDLRGRLDQALQPHTIA